MVKNFMENAIGIVRYLSNLINILYVKYLSSLKFQWKPNPLFKPGYNFANYIDIIYPKPEDSLPASYVNYLKDVFLDTDSYYPGKLIEVMYVES